MKRQFGFSIIELLVSTVVFAIAVLGITWIMASTAKHQSAQRLSSGLATVRLQFQKLITNDLAWNLTVMNNSSMSCLNHHLSCTLAAALGPQNLKLYDQNSNLFYDGSNATTGFKVDGTPCTTFPASPCVLHLALNWTAQCDSTTQLDPNCLAPYINIQGTFSAVGASTLASVNWANFNIQYSRAVARGIASTTPCPLPPVAGCLSPKFWLCIAGAWQCHYVIP